MQQKTITLNKFGIPEMLLNCDRGAYGVGKNMYFLWRDMREQCIKAYYLKGVSETDDTYKLITMKWGYLKIFPKYPMQLADELKPLPEYFDAEGNCLHNFIYEDVPLVKTTSHGKVEVVPGVYRWSYDLFYDLDAKGRAGTILHGIAMQKFGITEWSVNLIDIDLEKGLSIFQPVIGNVEVIGSDVLIKALDGIAPFVFKLGDVEIESDDEALFSDLENGNYEVVITDSMNKQYRTNIVINHGTDTTNTQ